MEVRALAAAPAEKVREGLDRIDQPCNRDLLFPPQAILQVAPCARARPWHRRLDSRGNAKDLIAPGNYGGRLIPGGLIPEYGRL